jgi:glycosyltransferase involved in cell wall biosynthesis
MMYPRTLILSIVRVNLADNVNNGLLLRNLFGKWPRENLAQICSGGSNGDEGFCSRYYLLGPNDRLFGGLFTRLKATARREAVDAAPAGGMPAGIRNRGRLKAHTWRVLISSGLNELLFPIRPSRRLVSWARHFRPDIIFAQGYNLAFTQLPLALASRLKVPIVYYPTDDWPKTIYREYPDPPISLSRLPRSVISFFSKRLVRKSGVCIAFNRMMRDAYRIRYRKEFAVLMHGDVRARFDALRPAHPTSIGMKEIVSTGVFDRCRMPLILDLEIACAILSSRGIAAGASIYPVNYPLELPARGNPLSHLSFRQCPSHNQLIAVLKSADVLLLLERFDESVPGIRLSVSSKAHLFMYSDKPIIVYSDARTGVARYANESGWARVVDRRDPHILADAIELLLLNQDQRLKVVERAHVIADVNHDLLKIQSSFIALCNSLVSQSLSSREERE